MKMQNLLSLSDSAEMQKKNQEKKKKECPGYNTMFGRKQQAYCSQAIHFCLNLKIAQCQRTHLCFAKAILVQAGITATPQRGRGEITASLRGETERHERENGGGEVQTDCDKN